MSVINTQPLAGASGQGVAGYNLTKSLRFRSAASAYLSRTPASAGNRKTWTYSAWIKRGSLGSNQSLMVSGVGNSTDATFGNFGFSSGDVFNFQAYNQAWRTTTQVFRDPAAWYHIVLAFDTTQATAANRIKLYVNGVQVTSFSTSNDPVQNTDYAINQATATYISYPNYSYSYFDGYLAEVNFIDGQALTPSSFGENNADTGVWKPKRYAGTYGTNGFYLPFTDVATTSGSNAGLGKDFSGNGNYWTTNNISVTTGATYDSMTDVPTLTSATAANYAVLNPVQSAGNGYTLSNGNLTWSWAGGPGSFWQRATLAVSSGKWYWEVTPTTVDAGPNLIVGIQTPDAASSSGTSGTIGTGYGYYADGTKLTGTTFSSYGASWTNNDVIGVAFDADAGTLTFYKNNTSQGTAFTSITGAMSPVLLSYTGGTRTTAGSVNFGQRPFAYTPPTGYKALNTYNLPDSTIVAGNTVMDATTFTGNASGATVTNAAGFKPDLVWMKNRAAARNNELLNSVTGGSATLFSNLTNAEATDQRISSFNSNGFTYTSNSNSANTGEAIVGWQWQAGQGTTSSNTSGSITSTVSVNASAGFSIVTYTGNGSTGATVGHGLGVAPKLIIAKSRGAVTSWPVYHASLGATSWILLNSTNAATTSAQEWNNTAPTSTVFTIGSSSANSNQSAAYVAYCWSEIAGFSKFGSYTGNGSTDGAFVYTGFRPKFVMFKRTDSTEDWIIVDTARNTYNVANSYLLPSSSAAEGTITLYDFLSNGIKFRSTNQNISGASYIYMAFAENPFKNSLAR